MTSRSVWWRPSQCSLPRITALRASALEGVRIRSGSGPGQTKPSRLAERDAYHDGGHPAGRAIASALGMNPSRRIGASGGSVNIEDHVQQCANARMPGHYVLKLASILHIIEQGRRLAAVEQNFGSLRVRRKFSGTKTAPNLQRSEYCLTIVRRVLRKGCDPIPLADPLIEQGIRESVYPGANFRKCAERLVPKD